MFCCKCGKDSRNCVPACLVELTHTQWIEIPLHPSYSHKACSNFPVVSGSTFYQLHVEHDTPTRASPPGCCKL